MCCSNSKYWSSRPSSDTSQVCTVRCPACYGQQFKVLSPGRLQCTTELIIDAVPPGIGANRGYVPIPIYGPCNGIYDERTGAAAEAEYDQNRQAAKQREDQARAEREKNAEIQTDLERRKDAALLALRKAGNPGTQPRRIAGWFGYTLLERLLGKPGHDVYVDAEPAWPIGTLTWVHDGSHGVEHVEQLETGYTPSRRYVPMQYGTEGDDVHILNRRRRIRAGFYSRDYSREHPRTSVQLVEGLERVVKKIPKR